MPRRSARHQPPRIWPMTSVEENIVAALAVLTASERGLIWMRFGVGSPPPEPIPSFPQRLARKMEERVLRKLRAEARGSTPDGRATVLRRPHRRPQLVDLH